MGHKHRLGSGVGKADSKLNAFDRALVASGVGNYNLIKVSSILPKGSMEIDSILLEEGELLPVAYAEYTSEPGKEEKIITAAIAIGIPANQNCVGVIMEWSGLESEEYAKEKVTSMVKCAMEDRDIDNYCISIESISSKTSEDKYVCVFACVSLILDIKV